MCYADRWRSLQHDSQAGTIILKIVYGYTVDPHKPDPLVQLIGEAMERFAVSVVAGSWFVDIIPACKSFLYTLIPVYRLQVKSRYSVRHFPKWMPGTGWKEEARASRVIAREVSQVGLYEWFNTSFGKVSALRHGELMHAPKIPYK